MPQWLAHAPRIGSQGAVDELDRLGGRLLGESAAREALTFCGNVFGCTVHLHTFAEFNRTDGPADAVAHGYLSKGPVALFASDNAEDDPPFKCEGMILALLGTAAPATVREWFARLCEGGRVVDDLQTRPWGAADGQVIDRFGLHRLIGYEGANSD